MFCNQCGSPIPEGNRFCEKCGAPAPGTKGRRPSKGNPDPAGKTSSGSGKQRKRIILIAAIVVIAGCIGGGIAFVTQGHSAEYENKLETAQRYVADGKLDEAENVYLGLIKSQPKKEPAYLELGQVYMTQEKYDKALDILKHGEKNTGKKEMFSEPIKAAKEQYGAVWKTAYRKILEEQQDLLERYEYPEYGDPRPTVALCDIDGDGTPELFVMRPQDSNPDMANLYIYTYRDGKAVALEYSYPTYGDRSLDSGEPMHDVNAAAGTTYTVFKLKSSDRLVIATTMGDEDWESYFCTYELKSDLTMSSDVWGEGFAIGENGPGEGTYSFFHGAEDITEEEFDKEADKLEADIGELLYYVPSGYADELAFDKVASMSPKAMFAADAIRQLTVKEAPAGDTSKSSADDSILKELDKKSFIYSSGAGGWANIFEFGPGGTFKGTYSDSNMGETGDGYPNGTRYQSDYTGTFKDPKKVGEHEYTLTLESLELKRSEGESEIEDGVLVEYTEPYGLDGLKPGDKVRLLIPGFSLSDLTEEQASWFTLVEEVGTLGRYGLINENSSTSGGAIFFESKE